MNSYCLLQEISRAMEGQRTQEKDLPAEPDVRTVKNLFLLLVADRYLHPEIYGKCVRWSRRNMLEIIERNAPLIHAFSVFFAEIITGLEKYEQDIIRLNEWMDNISRDELLHLPGHVHEFIMSFSGARKKQGSYYTPSDIVKYMVENSLNYLIKSCGNHHTENIKVLDPACGGASFLIETWKQLVEWGFPELKALESIYGTDIDEEAVNLSIFVLTVAVLGSGRENIDVQKIKNILQNQIKPGNALAVPGRMFNGAINWEKVFPLVFGPGIPRNLKGFSLVIGNPPYIPNKLIPAREKKYYRENYISATGQYDLSVVFMEQGLNLLRRQGVLSYIISNKFMAADYGESIRREILLNRKLIELIDVSTIKAFERVSVYPVIINLEKTKPNGEKNFVTLQKVRSLKELGRIAPVEIDQRYFLSRRGCLITTQLTGDILPVINKIERIFGRINVKYVRCGLAETGFNKWIVEAREENDKTEEGIYPFVRAGHIKPYRITSYDRIDASHIKPSARKEFKGPKLVIPGIARRLMAAVDWTDSILGRVYYIKETETEFALEYLAVLFNSILLNFYYRVMYWPVHLAGDYLRFNSTYIANIPVYSAFDEESGKRTQVTVNIAQLGRRMLADSRARNKLPQDTGTLANKAEALVFELYGLNVKEADIVMRFMGITELQRTEIISLMGAGE